MEIYESNPVPVLPATIEEWTADDEGKLQRLKCSEIDVADTAVEGQQALMRHQFCAAGVELLDDKFDHIINLWKRKHKETSAD